MQLAELLSRLVNQGDFDYTQYNDIVQVEIADSVYVDIKEIYYLSFPDRVIIRLENIK